MSGTSVFTYARLAVEEAIFQQLGDTLNELKEGSTGSYQHLAPLVQAFKSITAILVDFGSGHAGFETTMTALKEVEQTLKNWFAKIRRAAAVDCH